MNTKILLISDTVYDTNGVSRFIQDMAAQARAKSEPFSVLSASPLAPERPETNIVNFVPMWNIRMPYYKEQFLTLLPPLIRMFGYIGEHRPDIIHISTPGPVGLAAFLIAKLKGIPVAGTYHTDFPSYIRKQTHSETAERVTRGFMRFFYRRMRKVFSRSKHYLGVLQQELALRPERLFFLPPGTNIQRFTPQNRRDGIWNETGVPEEGIKLLYVGRLSPEKNFMFVIELFEKLQEQSAIPLSMIVVGEGALSEAVTERRNGAIHLLGVRKGQQLAEIYASSDIMLFASETETLGQVVMEAQASGLPCIVSDKGGVVDIIRDGESGYCVATGDEKRWLESVKRLVEDTDLRKDMSETAFRQMQERSIEKTYKNFVELHEAVVKEA